MTLPRLPELLRDERRPASEEGVTHSSDPRHPFWRLRVRFASGLAPTVETVRAPSADRALDFICARYPFADRRRCEVLGRVEGHPPRHTAPSPAPAEAPARPAAAKPAASPRPAPEAPAADAQPAPSAPPDPAPTPAASVAAAEPLGLQPLERDSRDRAIITDDAIRQASAAHGAGTCWDLIAEAFGCDARHLRAKVTKWERAVGVARTRVPVRRSRLIQQERPIALLDGGLPAAGPTAQTFDVFLVRRPAGVRSREAVDPPVLIARGVPLAAAERLTQALADIGGWAERQQTSGAPVTIADIGSARAATPAAAAIAADGLCRFTVEVAVRPVVA